MVEEAAILELGRHLALLQVVEEVAILVVLLQSHSASLHLALLEEALLEVGAALLEVAPSQHQQVGQV